MARIGVQMMMLKSKVEESGPFEVLRQLTDVGFSVVEVSQIPMTQENVAEMVRARDELGIEYASLSAAMQPGGNDDLTTQFDKIVADCRALGSTMLRIGMMPLEAMVSHEALLEFCRQAQDVALRLADEGIQLYYHNHHAEFAKVDGKYMLDIIREEAPEMRLEIDVHWVQRGGKDPVRTLQKYAGLVDLVHLKDFRIGTISQAAYDAAKGGDSSLFQAEFSTLEQFAEVGEGTLDWKEIIDVALESGAQYLLIEQDKQYGRDPFDCLATSRENLVNLGFEHLI